MFSLVGIFVGFLFHNEILPLRWLQSVHFPGSDTRLSSDLCQVGCEVCSSANLQATMLRLLMASMAATAIAGGPFLGKETCVETSCRYARNMQSVGSDELSCDINVCRVY